MPNSFQLTFDSARPDACTLILPSGRKIRVAEYPDGRIRFRIYEGGPMGIYEAFLPGEKKHVIITLGPTGWKPTHGAVSEEDVPASPGL